MTAASFRELAESAPCPRCMALVGESCRTDGSRGGEPRNTWPHQVRSRPVLEAWQAGHAEGMREAVLSVAWRQRIRPRPGVAQVGLEDLLLEFADGRRLDLTVKDLRR